MHIPLGPLRGPLGRDLRAAAGRDAADVVDAAPVTDGSPVTDDDLDGLPEAAQRYLRRMGVVGRPRDTGFVVRFAGRFKRPGLPWMPCEAWQVNLATPVTRLFHMRIDFAWVLPMVGRDAYVDGTGSMKGRLFDLITVADGAGPEFDLGELVTWVNDAVLLAPSMLLTEATTWSAVDPADRTDVGRAGDGQADDGIVAEDRAGGERDGGAFDLTVTDQGHTVSARVFLDADDRVRDFATEDRWCDLPSGLVRARWTTPVEGWTEADGRPWPLRAQAVWHLPDGPMPYVEGRFFPDTMARGASPADLLAGRAG